MSSRQVEQILITNVYCNHLEHQGRIIDVLCLNPKCEAPSSLCSKCLSKGHSQCRDYVCELEEIPNKLMELRQLQLDLLVLQDKINQRFKELVSHIEQILSPISRYQESPNLTNLNLIGSLLKQDSRWSVIQSMDDTKTQIKQLLDYQNVQKENQKETMKKDQMPQQSKEQSQNELEIDVYSLYWKGRSLYSLENYIDAIDCFDKAIQIDPKHIGSWLVKGFSLYMLKNYIDAIQCYEEALKYQPSNQILKDKLQKAKNTLKGKQKTSCHQQ